MATCPLYSVDKVVTRTLRSGQLQRKTEEAVTPGSSTPGSWPLKFGRIEHPFKISLKGIELLRPISQVVYRWCLSSACMQRHGFALTVTTLTKWLVGVQTRL